MDLTDEQVAVRAANEIEQQLGVQDGKVLTIEEFLEEVEESPEWLNTDSDEYILRAEMYGDPELPMVKTVSDLMSDTQTQVYFIEENHTFYVCPTTNKFDIINQILSQS